MASYYEPMDLDEGELEPDFDKENAFRANRDNVPRTPTAEKGYEELDVSELNMKLRMSCTPIGSPTPRRFFGSCNQKLFPDSGDDSFNTTVAENPNVTLTLASGDQNDNSRLRTSNSTIEVDGNQNATGSNHFNDSTFSSECVVNNNTYISKSNEDISTPTVSNSTTPIATTPTKAFPNNSTSPIMRGLKSVLSMFRPSQSPITSADGNLAIIDNDLAQSGISPSPTIDEQNIKSSSKNLLASTPVRENKAIKGEQMSIKGNSPHIPESIVFNEDLMNELQWNDDTTIVFNKNKLPGRKLYTSLSPRESGSSCGSYSRDSNLSAEPTPNLSDSKKIDEQIQDPESSADTTVEYMDTSVNDARLHNSLDSKQESVILKKHEEIACAAFDSVVDRFSKTTRTAIEDLDPINCHIKSESNIDSFDGGTFVSADDKEHMEMYSDAVDTNLEGLIEADDIVTLNNINIFRHAEISEKNKESYLNLKEEKDEECLKSVKITNNKEIQEKHDISLDVTYRNITETTAVSPLEGMKETSHIDKINESLEMEFQEKDTLEENVEWQQQNDIYIQINSDDIENHIVTTSLDSKTLPSSEINCKNIASTCATTSILTVSPPSRLSETFHEVSSRTTEYDVNYKFIDYVNSKNICETLDCRMAYNKIANIEDGTCRHSDEANKQDCIATLATLCNQQIKNNIGSEAISSDSLSNLSEMPILENNISTKLHEKIQIKNNYIDLDNSLNYQHLRGREDEEIVTSENNSPYVSLNAPTEDEIVQISGNADLTFDTTENPFVTKSRVTVSPPPNDMNFDNIENPFVTKSRITISPQHQVNDVLKEDIQTKFETKAFDDKLTIAEEVAASQPESKLHDIVKLELVADQADDTSDIYFKPCVSTLMNGVSQNSKVCNQMEILSENEFSDSKEIFENAYMSSLNAYNYEIENTTKNCTGILTLKHVGEVVNGTDSQEHSSFYESAENSSGRTSEQLLESELEIIDHNKEVEANGQEFDYVNPFATISKIETSPLTVQELSTEPIKVNISDLENPFVTKCKIRMSPPLTNETTLLNLSSEKGFDRKSKLKNCLLATKVENSNMEKKLTDESPFVSRTKIRMSPPLANNETSLKNEPSNIPFTPKRNVMKPLSSQKKMKLKLKDLPDFNAESPFETKNKIRMSPPLTLECTNQKIVDISTAEFENPFATKSKIRMSPPPITVTPSKVDFKPIAHENPLASKSIIRMSPLPHDELKDNAQESFIKTLNKIENAHQVEAFVLHKDNEVSLDLSVDKSGFTLPDTEILHNTDVNTIVSIEMNTDKMELPFTDTEVLPSIDASSAVSIDLNAQIQDPLISDSKIFPNNDANSTIAIEINTDKTEWPLPGINTLSNTNAISTSAIEMNENKKVQPDPELLPNINEKSAISIEVNADRQALPLHSTEIFPNFDSNNTVVISNLSENGFLDNDATTSSEGSNIFDEKNSTIREVKTEDEDTMEGPDFAELTTDNIENLFEAKSKIQMSTPFHKSEKFMNSPKIIICSDLKQTLTLDSAQVSNSDNDFEECTDEEFKPGELFINADEFDFLMNQATVGETKDYGKESLFLKFDPLCANKRTSTGIVTALLPKDEIAFATEAILSLNAVETEEIPGLNAVATEDIPSLNIVVTEGIPTLNAVATEAIASLNAVESEEIASLDAVTTEYISSRHDFATEDIPNLNAFATEDIPSLNDFPIEDISSLNAVASEDIPSPNAVPKENIPSLNALVTEDIPSLNTFVTEDILSLNAFPIADISSLNAAATEDIPSPNAVATENIPSLNALATEDIPSLNAFAIEDIASLNAFVTEDILSLNAVQTEDIPSLNAVATVDIPSLNPVETEIPSLSAVETEEIPSPNSVPIENMPSLNALATEEMFNLAKDQNNVISLRSEKPTMVVIPAVNDQSLTSNVPYTPPSRPDRRSMTFSSPAIAAIDRLISLSGNNSPNQTFNVSERQSQESAEAIMQLRDLLAEKEQQVQQLRVESKNLHNRLTELQKQMHGLEEDNEERLKKMNDLQAKLAHKTVLNKNMAAAVEEYERAISGMIGENEQEKQRHQQERSNLIKERDEQVAHLASMEVSFSDLHTKYERTKQVILLYKGNEELFRKTIEEYKNNVMKLESNYDLLKQQAINKLNNSNLELEKIKKSHEAEVLKLTALIKRKELHATSLEESLAQKVKANEELTAICDELISKVG